MFDGRIAIPWTKPNPGGSGRRELARGWRGGSDKGSACGCQMATRHLSAPVAPVQAGLSLERAVPMFLDYLRSCRSCSPLSIRSYAADLQYLQAPNGPT